jgi:hypothetical protein
MLSLQIFVFKMTADSEELFDPRKLTVFTSGPKLDLVDVCISFKDCQ